MINGIVIGRQPQVKVIVRISGFPDLEINCVINTGFEGALALPAAAISKLQLPYVMSINTNLAIMRILLPQFIELQSSGMGWSWRYQY